MTTESFGELSPSIPQWKKDLIIRRRAVGRVLPTGSGSVQLTCPSVVRAVRLAEYSVNSDSHRNTEGEREQTGAYKNMRFIEQVNASHDFVEPCIVPCIKEIITKIESGCSEELKMGEEKNSKKKYNSSLICDKKMNKLSGGSGGGGGGGGGGCDDDSASDSSEEFKYGPGIVSKLKSKYLSLTLRESQGKTRPSLASLRRASSMENILNSTEPEKTGEYKLNYLKNIQPVVNGSSSPRCRGLTRHTTKESMKRARSVEVLTRYDKKNVVSNRRSLDAYPKDGESDNDEKTNIRNRVSSLSVEETELPPPDLVKQTLQIFEKSQSSYKNDFNTKNKVSKKTESVCAKKPVICPKPVTAKQNGVQKVELKRSPNMKYSTENVNQTSNDFLKSKFLNENVSQNLRNYSQTAPASTTEGDPTGNVSKRKVAFLKDNCIESVINSNSSPESAVKAAENDESIEKNITSCPVSKNGLSLDLTDKGTILTSKQSSSSSSSSSSSPSQINTSLKTNSEKTSVLPDSSDPLRCISPVLVRAPPSILSTELNPSNQPPSPQMKQVGVIRPIVTNKAVQSNLPKYQLNKSNLTEREIEKNLINKVRCIEQPVTKVIVSLKKSPEECTVNEATKPKEANKTGQFWDKKPNTVVFNFSNRKTVPDYIENDGLILAQRKEKPKLGEPGIIILSRESEESTTDFDPEELTSEPPLVCDIVFEGDNILINGRSNIQTKPKTKKMKIQFNDEATTLFEYPSEASLLEDQENVKPEVDVSVTGTGTDTPRLPIPFRCGSLASYTPSKVPLSTDFQLGITKTAPPTTSKPVQQEEVQEEEDGEVDGCLRPADESSTVQWSSETAADLLF